MFDDITRAYPSIDTLDGPDRAFLDALPAEFRAFLAEHNGGFAEPFRYTFRTGVPFKSEEVDVPTRDDCPVEFFGIPTTRTIPDTRPRSMR